ncbi:uncharacterized protein EI90DRAFT_381345 [Cantharellus anzutake]|uniref:uncharacterized protein n=1 Tax=Cantharellus anzutake TaxID=1750568 RepID=UPI001904CF71|nr:uncharacterized protein EI90DRAFT_381345 [Cantharellus anzutake]KAF8334963.1 hypothetical protein EI90DRAFT_381345 [Cantharellus anzutake]
MESDTTPLSAPEVPAETVKTDDNATTLPPTPVDGSPSRDALRPSDTDSNDNAEAKVEELTATLPPEQPSPTIASAEPSDPLNNITVTTPSEPKAERAEPELSACSVPPVTSTPTSSPSLKPHEGDCTPPENKDERSAEGHSVAESVSSATTVAATTIGVTEDKRSPTVNGTAGTTPTSSPSRAEVINTSSEGKQLVVDPPHPHLHHLESQRPRPH